MDCDNVAFAKKYILDGLKEAKIIPDDSRKYVAGLGGDFFEIDKNNPRVEVAFIPEELFPVPRVQ